jgi:Surfeit locus protein 6
VPEDGTITEPSKPKNMEVLLAPGQSRIEALRAKLHAKIAAKRGTATTTTPTEAASNSEAVSKRAARRLEKNRRKLEAQRRKATTTSTAEQQHQTKSYTVTPNTTTTNDASSSSTMLQDLQHIDFGRLTGLDSRTASGTVDTKNYAAVNKSLQNLSKGKNLHKLLADAEAKRLKLQQLKASTDAADQEKVAQLQWTDTFKEADGTRVKDDPKRLKKAIARKDATKRKSKKAWQSRMEQTQSAAQQRQQIRQHNLQARKQGGSVGANLSSQKIKDNSGSAAAATAATAGSAGGSADQKGRRLSRAGFEGRKPDFLNSAKKEHHARSSSSSSNHGGGANK